MTSSVLSLATQFRLPATDNSVVRSQKGARAASVASLASKDRQGTIGHFAQMVRFLDWEHWRGEPRVRRRGRFRVFEFLSRGAPIRGLPVRSILMKRCHHGVREPKRYYELPGLALREICAERADRLWVRGGFPKSFLAHSDRESFAVFQTFLDEDEIFEIWRQLVLLGTANAGTRSLLNEPVQHCSKPGYCPNFESATNRGKMNGMTASPYVEVGMYAGL